MRVEVNSKTDIKAVADWISAHQLIVSGLCYMQLLQTAINIIFFEQKTQLLVVQRHKI